jgi:hypothetical protein
MKFIYILLLLSGMILSGCISNPAKQVPVVQVNITFVEQQGIAQVVDYKLTQKTVNYLSRPKTTVAESFPAIAARTMIIKGKNSSIGPWETLPYKGDGTYSFNIGFNEDDYPFINDSVKVTLMVVDIKGQRIGDFVQDIIWK